MRILIFGTQGQLGTCLVPMLSDHTLITPTLEEVDFTRANTITSAIRSSNADYIINLAAYTAVDKAESQQELADAINHLAVAEIARACRDLELPLLQISTDFVFSGTQSTPYQPTDTCAPLSCYGLTKCAGEQAILELDLPNYVIVRTAWLYSDVGANFLLTMLRLMNERKLLNVVADQIGTPTSAYSLSAAIQRFVELPSGGIYHWTDAGAASWYDFAVAIYEEALIRNLVPPGVQIYPISSAEYPTPAKRPSYSVLDKSATYAALDMQPIHWREQLRQVLDHIAGRS